MYLSDTYASSHKVGDCVYYIFIYLQLLSWASIGNKHTHSQKEKASPLKFIFLTLFCTRGQQIAKDRQKVQENNEIMLVTIKCSGLAN